MALIRLREEKVLALATVHLDRAIAGTISCLWCRCTAAQPRVEGVGAFERHRGDQTRTRRHPDGDGDETKEIVTVASTCGIWKMVARPQVVVIKGATRYCGVRPSARDSEGATGPSNRQEVPCGRAEPRSAGAASGAARSPRPADLDGTESGAGRHSSSLAQCGAEAQPTYRRTYAATPREAGVRTMSEMTSRPPDEGIARCRRRTAACPGRLITPCSSRHTTDASTRGGAPPALAELDWASPGARRPRGRARDLRVSQTITRPPGPTGGPRNASCRPDPGEHDLARLEVRR